MTQLPGGAKYAVKLCSKKAVIDGNHLNTVKP